MLVGNITSITTLYNKIDFSNATSQYAYKNENVFGGM